MIVALLASSWQLLKYIEYELEFHRLLYLVAMCRIGEVRSYLPNHRSLRCWGENTKEDSRRIDRQIIAKVHRWNLSHSSGRISSAKLYQAIIGPICRNARSLQKLWVLFPNNSSDSIDHHTRVGANHIHTNLSIWEGYLWLS